MCDVKLFFLCRSFFWDLLVSMEANECPWNGKSKYWLKLSGFGMCFKGDRFEGFWGLMPNYYFLNILFLEFHKVGKGSYKESTLWILNGVLYPRTYPGKTMGYRTPSRIFGSFLLASLRFKSCSRGNVM